MENAPLGLASAKAAGVGYVIGVTTTLPAEYLKGADDIMQWYREYRGMPCAGSWGKDETVTPEMWQNDRN